MIEEILEEMELEETEELLISLTDLRKTWAEILYTIEKLLQSDDLILLKAERPFEVKERERSFTVSHYHKRYFVFKNEVTKKIFLMYIDYIHDIIVDDRNFIRGVAIKVKKP